MLIVWRFIVSDKSRKGGVSAFHATATEGALIWTIIKTGFGVWRSNANDIFRLGFLPIAVSVALTAYTVWSGMDGAFTGLGFQKNNPEIIDIGIFNFLEIKILCLSLVSIFLYSLVIGRLSGLFILGNVEGQWWSLLPDAVTFRVLWAQIKMLLFLLLLGIPFFVLAFGVSSLVSGFDPEASLMKYFPLLCLMVMAYAGVRLFPYVLARAVGFKETLRSTWRAMGGSRTWQLIGALLVAGLAQLLTNSVIGSTLRLVFWSDMSLDDGIQPEFLHKFALGSAIVDFMVGLFFYPVFIAMVACALKMALEAREAHSMKIE